MIGNRANTLGIYISIPFCRSKCTYCNFASGVYPGADHARYIDRVIEDIRCAADWAAQIDAELPRQVDTVYLGGGTPSVLAPELLAKLFAAMRSEFDFDADAEITVECAPGQLADEMPEALAAAGVNRVSLGVQSFVDSEAHASGRLHDRATVETDLRRLRAAGIDNLNVDLIAGLPGQTFASWEDSLDAMIGSETPHASVYMLEVDEDSRLGREMLSGGSRYRAGLVPADDAIASMYETAIARLDSAGLQQYEISNFSRPGFESRHNLRYWQRLPYIGFGLDASSMLPVISNSNSVNHHAGTCNILRATTTDDLTAYLDGGHAAQTTTISAEQQHEEAWFLGLRMNTGVEMSALAREFGREITEPSMEIAARLAGDGLLAIDGECVRLTPRGRLISNDVFQEFLSLSSREAVALS